MIQQEVRDGWIYRNGIKIRPAGQYPESEADRRAYLRAVRRTDRQAQIDRKRIEQVQRQNYMPCETCGGLPCMEGCR